MPLYETVMQEKPPVVLEIGNVYTKIGFAAEAFPRHIIPTNVFVTTTRNTKKLFDFENTSELYDQMVDFLQEIFFKYVLVSPKDRKIVIVESIFNPTDIRETFAKILFRHFEVSSLLFVPSHLVSLATLAIDTAVVLDLGYKETTILPVYCGVQVLNAFNSQQYGGEAIHMEIKRQLLECGIKEELLNNEILEDIKIRTCFVTTFERARQYNEGNPPPPPPDVKYIINGKETIKIPGKVRETAMEIFFTEDNENSSLPHQILDSILKCNMDMRKCLAENIFLIGGSSMIMGFMARLKKELNNLKDSDIYKEKLFIKTFKFHTAPGKANFTSWLGGSIYGGTDLVLTRSLTKEAYSKCTRVPDWINLDSNRAPSSQILKSLTLQN